jgi:RNA-directed DNA polymerase
MGSGHGDEPRTRSLRFTTTRRATAPYEWVFEGDIEACFDEIDHTALMARVRGRVADKRVLGLIRALLKAGVLSEDGLNRDTRTGTPQGGILSPLLANIALSVLDEHFRAKWESARPRVGTREASPGRGRDDEAHPLCR